MKRIFSTFAAFGLLAAVSACGTYDVAGVEGMTPSGGAFNSSLHSEYLIQAKEEISEGDWGNGAYFLEKSRRAAMGENVGPTELSERTLPDGTVGTLTSARGRLMSALGRGVANSTPQTAAHAQAMFDCWMEEQEENIQPKDIEACRSKFEAAMAQLAGTSTMPFNKQAYIIYFDFNSSKLTKDGQSVVDLIKRNYAQGNVSVVGHTDTSGSSAYNETLSMRRAATVRKALVAAGIPASAINVGHNGERQLRVMTPDRVREGGNRRVEVTIN